MNKTKYFLRALSKPATTPLNMLLLPDTFSPHPGLVPVLLVELGWTGLSPL